MQAKSRYIILFYDHSENVLSMKQLLHHLPVAVEADCVENFQQLLDHLDNRLPDFIIVYVNNPVKGYIDHLKSLRVNNGIDEIPVYVFTELPDKQTLIDLMN
jgi:response regulator RpfG family c-di-GMP phosphodiesterase